MISPYSHSLRQPFQVKISTIKSISNTIKKIIGVALVLFILFIACLFPLAPIHTALKPDSDQPIKTFPPYLEKTMYPGLMSGEEGRFCKIPDTMPTFEECNHVSKSMETSLKQDFPSEYMQFHTLPEYVYGKGGSATIPRGMSIPIKMTYFGMDKRKAIAYNQALSYVEKEVLHSLESLPPKEFVNAIKKTNKLVTKFINKQPGALRMNNQLQYYGNTDLSRNDMRKLFYKQGGQGKDLKTFESLYDHIEKSDRLDVGELTQDERRVLKIVAHIPPNSHEILSELDAFAKSFLNVTADPLAKAAFVHRELYAISPFKHGNGRTARIWMNMFLQIGGYKAIVFPKTEDYKAAAIEDRKTPGTFTAYLKKVIEWNRLQHTLK